MRIIITKKQKHKLFESISNGKVICEKCGWSWNLSDGGDDPYVCHKCGKHNIRENLKLEFDDEPTKYTYTTIGLFERGATKRYYFNNVLPVNDDNPLPNKIKINGDSGDFIFDKDLLIINPDKKTIAVNKDIFDNQYPDFKKTKKSEEVGITPNNIKIALKNAFPENWIEETPEFTPGLRGIYTIGEKMGNNEEDWSIMNYFDTKDEIHSLLYLKYSDEKPDEDIITWMTNLFKNNKEFTKLLVDRQWSSIYNGFNLERESVKNFINKLNSSSIKYYPHGSKMDRWLGVDVTVDGINYQIKPLKSYKEENGNILVNTYGMRDYIKKKDVNKIAFSNNKEVIIFNNNNYKVISKNLVIFSEKPEILN